MGEFNSEIREHSELKQQLLALVENYSYVAICALKKTFIEYNTTLFNRYNEMYDAYRHEFEKVCITGKGEVIYEGRKFVTKNEIAIFLTIHINQLCNILNFAFEDIDIVRAIHEEYIDFWHEYLLSVRK